MRTAIALLFGIALTYGGPSPAARSGQALAQNPLTVGVLLTHGAAYDGKLVTVAGTAKHVEHKTSKRGHAYTIFELCDLTDCVRVFQYGTLPVTDGQSRTVTGIFAVEKRVGSVVYHDEIDVH
jgi:hypothetical protein